MRSLNVRPCYHENSKALGIISRVYPTTVRGWTASLLFIRKLTAWIAANVYAYVHALSVPINFFVLLSL